MKIEKINDNQIRCTLNKTDLASRQIKISELAYGTEKAKRLFKDMMQQASTEFGFEAEDIPLMIEAIPVSTECIVLVITKVEDPEELDTRFSKFTASQDDNEDYDDESSSNDDVVDLLKQIKEDNFVPLSDAIAPFKKEATDNAKKTAAVENSNILYKLFMFDNLSTVVTVAKLLSGVYSGLNTLYKDNVSGNYYLYVEQSSHPNEEFIKICNLVSEYSKPLKTTYAKKSFMEEHYEPLVKLNALQKMC